MKLGKRLALVLAAVLALNLAAAVASLWLLFARYEGDAREVPERCELMRFDSDGIELQGYYFPGERGLVLMVPGFRSVALNYLPVIDALNARGWAVFTFDAAGTGRSGGSSQRGFPQILADARAARRYVDGAGRFGHDALLLMGHSRGAYGVAGALAGADGAVLVSGVDNALDTQTQAMANWATWPLCTGWPALWLTQAIWFGPEDAGFSASDALVREEVPALLVQGEDDAVTPAVAHSVWSHRAELPDRVQTLWVATDGDDGHTTVLYADGAANGAVMDAISAFFEACLEAAAASVHLRAVLF